MLVSLVSSVRPARHPCLPLPFFPSRHLSTLHPIRLPPFCTFLLLSRAARAFWLSPFPKGAECQAYCEDNYLACTHNDPAQRGDYHNAATYLEPAPDYYAPIGRGHGGPDHVNWCVRMRVPCHTI